MTDDRPSVPIVQYVDKRLSVEQDQLDRRFGDLGEKMRLMTESMSDSMDRLNERITRIELEAQRVRGRQIDSTIIAIGIALVGLLGFFINHIRISH